MFARLPWKRPRGTAKKVPDRNAFRAFQDINDHTLRDIGLSRPYVNYCRGGCDPCHGPGPH